MTEPWKQELWDTHGRSQTLDAATILRLVGLREEVHPRDVVAFLYPTQEAADAYAEANLEHYGMPVLARLTVPAGAVSVLDLRSQFAEHGQKVTDPSRPDGYPR